MAGETIVRVTISRQRVKRLLRLLPRLLSGKVPDPTGRVKDLQIAMGMALLQLIQKAYKDKAQGGTDEAGEKWKPLSPVTIERRMKKGRSAEDIKKLRKLWKSKGWGEFSGDAVEILIDTGRLFRSLTAGISSGDQVFRVNPGEVVVGTNAKSDEGKPYPADHHYGTMWIPQRRLWPAVENWPQRWHMVLNDVLRRGIMNLIRDLLVYEASRGSDAL